MYVKELSLQNFRSYEHVTVAFPAGVSALVGSNGQGKTNLVEALAYTATLGSHRVNSDLPLIRHGLDQAKIRVAVAHDGREIEIEIEIIAGKANKAYLNGSPLKRPRDVLGYLNVVVFAPEDLALVKGDPSDRRAFLDQTMIALSPRLAGTRSDLDRVLKQRNALLKTAQQAARRSTGDVMRTLDVWDAQFANLSAQIVIERMNLVDALLPFTQTLYEQVSDDRGPFEMAYECSLPEHPVERSVAAWEASFLQALSERRTDEIDRGISLVGPHRDELSINVRHLPVRGYASHGESWSAALTLRLASFELLRRDQPGGDPVLILDDVFAELDSRRRRRLVELTRTAEQTLVTAAVAEDVPTELDGTHFEVSGGEVLHVI